MPRVSLSDTVRQSLLASELTQAELAERAGTSQRLISEFMRGGEIKSESLDRLIAAVGIKWTVPTRTKLEKR